MRIYIQHKPEIMIPRRHAQMMSKVRVRSGFIILYPSLHVSTTPDKVDWTNKNDDAAEEEKSANPGKGQPEGANSTDEGEPGDPKQLPEIATATSLVSNAISKITSPPASPLAELSSKKSDATHDNLGETPASPQEVIGEETQQIPQEPISRPIRPLPKRSSGKNLNPSTSSSSTVINESSQDPPTPLATVTETSNEQGDPGASVQPNLTDEQGLASLVCNTQTLPLAKSSVLPLADAQTVKTAGPHPANIGDGQSSGSSPTPQQQPTPTQNTSHPSPSLPLPSSSTAMEGDPKYHVALPMS